MSTVYLNFSGQAMATSATPHAWLNTTGAGQTLTATATATQLGDQYTGGTLIGGSGDDSFYISDSSETINVATNTGVDTVYAWASYSLVNNVNNLTLETANTTGVANSGSDLMIALATGDTLIAGSGSDVMVDNGAGGDYFQIGANATQDVIYGFQASGANHDIIDLTGSSFTSFAQIQSHLTQDGADTLLTLSSTQQVLIRNTVASSLTAADFGLSVNLADVAPSFDGEFNTLSLYNPATGTGTWKTSFISGNQTGANSWTSRTLQTNSEQEIYVDPNYTGSAGGTTPLGLNPFSINNGVLTITASQTPTQDLAALNNFKYTSGLLTTEKSFSQTYGYFEMKAELPSGQGVWPAFWLLPADGSWPPELDVMEQIGGKNVYETSHSTNSSGSNIVTGFSSYVPGNSTGFHTYGVLWTPTTIAWYVDGVEVASTATPADMNKPMYMLVNLAIGGNWPGDASSNFTSAQMEIDYVKAYSLASLGLTGGAPPSSIETGGSPTTGSTTTTVSSTQTQQPTPTAPTSVADTYNAKAGAPLTVSAAQGVLANDTDNNGQALTATLAANGGPAHGTLVLNADGSFTYTPNAGFAGTDSFTYIPSDNSSTGTATTVTLHVSSAVPTTTAAAYSAKVGTALVEAAAQGVLAGDVDNNGLTLTASLAQNGGPSHGTLVLNADGSFTYTPNAGYAGTDSFTYIASDSLGSSTPTTVTLTVGATAPTTHSEAYGVKTGGSITESAAQGVLAGDVDNNGLTLSANLAPNGGPSHGVLTLNANGSFTYTPTAGYAGTDSFTYIASDGLSSSTPTTVTLNVSAAPIVTHSAAYSLREGSPLSTTAASGVLSFDSDSNGVPMQAQLASNGGPAHGTLTLNADGSFVYTPTAGYFGSDSFTYVVTDGATTSLPVTVGLKVTASPPQSHSDYYSVQTGSSLAVNAASGVLANDVDPNGLTLSAVVSGNGPAHGTLTFNADGSFNYTPTLGYVGTDSFKYVASDSQGSGTVTTVNLTVTDSAPTGKADTYLATEGTTLNVSAIKGVLANDVANNGLALSAKLDVGPSHGTLVLDANGSFSYTPNAGFVGTDTFVYTPSDSLVTGYGTTVTINVAAPAVGGSSPSTSSTGSATLIGGSGNDTYIVTNSAEQILVAAGTPNETVDASVSYALPANIQNLVLHGSGLTGAANSMADTLTSTGGANTLVGGSGSDTFYVNNVGDKVVVPNVHGNDLIVSSVSYALPTNVHSLQLTAAGLTGTGNAAGGNYIASMQGGDTLIGGAGGNDVFTISHSNDVIQVAAGTPNETVDAYCSYSLPANVQNLVGKGSAALTLGGNAMNNVITASTGADTLTGGGGSDTFVIATADRVETITDFSASDKIDISSFQSAGLSPTFTDHGTYSTVTFSDGDTIKLLGVHSSSLSVSGHYIV